MGSRHWCQRASTRRSDANGMLAGLLGSLHLAEGFMNVLLVGDNGRYGRPECVRHR